MDFPKVLTGLLSAAILVGCGSDDEVTAPEIGAEYSGKTTDAEFADHNKDALSEDIQAAVKAVTFVRYEEDYSDYRYLYAESVTLALTLNSILSAKSQEIESIIGTTEFPAFSDASVCTEGGSSTVSGSFDNLTIVAENYCIPDGEVSYTLFGELNYKVDGDNYEISMNNISLEMDLGEEAEYQEISGSGEINYERESNVSTLIVNSTLSGLGLTVSSKVTRNCLNGECTFDAEVLSENGIVYRAEDIEVAAQSNGYRGNAAFYLPNLGKASAAFYGIQYCEDGTIGGGSIFVRSESQTGELAISFNGCGESPSNIYYADGIPPQA